MVYVVQQQHEVKKIDTCDLNTRGRAIFTRTRSVVNGFGLLGGPFFGHGHDDMIQGHYDSLGALVLVASVAPGIPRSPTRRV